MLMIFVQQEYLSGGKISCCFQMKTDKIKCFPEESVGNCSARSFAPFILNVPPECCNICSGHLGERLANISQTTKPTGSGHWNMWEPLPACVCMGKDGTVLSVLIAQAFLSLLPPLWSNLGTKRLKRPEKGCLRRNGKKWGKTFSSPLLEKMQFRQIRGEKSLPFKVSVYTHLPPVLLPVTSFAVCKLSCCPHFAKVCTNKFTCTFCSCWVSP